MLPPAPPLSFQVSLARLAALNRLVLLLVYCMGQPASRASRPAARQAYPLAAQRCCSPCNPPVPMTVVRRSRAASQCPRPLRPWSPPPSCGAAGGLCGSAGAWHPHSLSLASALLQMAARRRRRARRSSRRCTRRRTVLRARRRTASPPSPCWTCGPSLATRLPRSRVRQGLMTSVC